MKAKDKPLTIGDDGPSPDGTYFSINDLGNARRLIYWHGAGVRHSPYHGKWLIRNSVGIWREDRRARMEKLARMTVKAILNDARSLADPTAANYDKKKALAMFKHGRGSGNRAGLTNMVVVAETEPGVRVLLDDLDRDPNLLGTKSGVLDLQTGNLIETDEIITKEIGVEFDPKATAPRWKKFLDEIFDGDQSMVEYIQRVVGYGLTGSTEEQVFFFLFGAGANGKSVFIEVLHALLQDYAVTARIETFASKAQRSGSGASGDLARLAGARLVTVNETELSQRLNEALIKDMTGSDRVVARQLYGREEEFTPEFKLMIRGNHKPQIVGTDDGIWRRLHLIPFTRQFSKDEQDPGLLKKLKNELPGIFAWAVQGCIDWRKSGLETPKAVRDAVAVYRSESDQVGLWINDCCVQNPGAQTAAGALYGSYQEWAGSTGETAMTQKAFCQELRRRFDKLKTSSGAKYKGLKLKSEINLYAVGDGTTGG